MPNGCTNHACQFGRTEIIFTPIPGAHAFGSFSLPVLFLFLFRPPLVPVPVPQHAIPEALALLFVLFYPNGLVVRVKVVGWIWRGMLCRGEILMGFQGPEHSQGGDTA